MTDVNQDEAFTKTNQLAQAEAAAPFFRGAASVPSLKPLLNLRGTLRRYLMRPVPVVFLLMAFTLQL